jgi:hypothetical protein
MFLQLREEVVPGLASCVFLLCAATRGARMLARNARARAAKSLVVYRGGEQERFSKPSPSATRPS